MASALLAMEFDAPLGATGAWGMCAEHVLGVSSGLRLDETRHIVVKSVFNIKSVFDVSVVHTIGSQLYGNKSLVGYKEATGQ